MDIFGVLSTLSLLWFCLAIFLPMFFLSQSKHWRIAMIGFAVWLGTIELWAKLESGKTLSQQFYAVPDSTAWIITVFWCTGWTLGLLYHLNHKRIRAWFKKDTRE